MRARPGMQKLVTAFLLLCLWLAAGAVHSAVKPWMLADWSNPSPHLADAGLRPVDVAGAIGPRMLLFPHAARDIVLPGAKGPRRFAQARFVSAVARVDLPAATLRRRLQDFSAYKDLFPLLTESEMVAMDGPNQVARYRVEVPLPAFATFTVDFRVKQRLEPDGSLSLLLIDGKAESLIAMLGGMTDELADQPVVGRWEFLPLNEKQSLLVFTYWDRLELKSFFARKFMEAYPELRMAAPYMVALMAVEPLRRTFVAAMPAKSDGRPESMQSLQGMRALIERLSANGHVAVVEPEPAPAAGGAPKPLRYVSMGVRIAAPLADTRAWATEYERLPDVLKELKEIKVKDRGQQVELDLNLAFAVLIIRFSLDLEVLNTWVAPNRLEFARTAGELAQLRGASEWHGLPGSSDTLMLISVAHEVGDEAPLLLRMASRLSTQLPYVDQAGMLIVQLVIMERMKPWIEKQAALDKKMAEAAEADQKETVNE